MKNLRYNDAGFPTPTCGASTSTTTVGASMSTGVCISASSGVFSIAAEPVGPIPIVGSGDSVIITRSGYQLEGMAGKL